MHAPERRDSTLELARALWTRRKWLAVLVLSAAFLAAASLTLALPNLYRATATVLVEQEAPEALAKAGAAELEPRLQVVTQQILGRERLQALIERFGLYSKMRRTASPEDVLERMRRDIRLERKEVQQRWGPGSTVAFTLSYQSWDPQIAAQVTNLLVSYYVEENEKILGRQAAGSQAAGTVDQITPLKRQLAELRSRFSDRYPDVVKLKAEIAALERHRPAPTAPPAAAAGAPGRAGDQFRILDSAVAPRDPFAPNRIRLLVMGLVLSLGVAAVAVLAAEQIDTSFHRVDDLREFTSVPVLAMILRIETRGDVWRQRLRLGAATALSGLAMALIFKVFYTVGRSGEQLVWILAQPGGGT